MNDDMNKRRDQLAKEHSQKHVATWTASGKKAVSFGFQKGFDAGVAEMQAQVDELKEANANCISLMLHEARMKNVESQLKAKDAVIDLAVKAGKHLSDVLEHSIELGHYTSGGSTEGWARLSVKEWNEAITSINEIINQTKQSSLKD